MKLFEQHQTFQLSRYDLGFIICLILFTGLSILIGKQLEESNAEDKVELPSLSNNDELDVKSSVFAI